MMLRYTKGCFLLLVLLSSFNNKTKRLQIDFYPEDISPSGRYMLYETPDEYDDGEYFFGDLRIMDIETGGITIVPDKILFNECRSFFLNNSMVTIPGDKCIELYNFQTEEYEKKPLLAYDKKFILLQFSLNEDRSEAALILLDFDKPAYEDSKYGLMYRVEFKVVELKTGKECVDEHADFQSGMDIHSGTITWYKNGVFYDYQSSSCYYYDLAKRKSIKVEEEEKFRAEHEHELITGKLPTSDKSIIYKNKGLTIQLLCTPIKYTRDTIIRKELLVSRDGN